MRSTLSHAATVLSLFAMVLPGCAGASPAQSVDSTSAASRAGTPEHVITAAHPKLIQRSGASLVVNGQMFVDRGNCEEDGDCEHFRADGVWRGQYVGVEVNGYEDQDYFLVLNNYHIPIGSRPISSPGGTRFFTGHHDDRSWSPMQGASVWEWEPFPRRVRIVDTDLVVFETFVAWRGERCVEYTGARGYNVKSEPTRTFWLAEQDGDWRLFESLPDICR